MSKKKPRLFIVDDDESVCDALKWLVISAGFEAETFSSVRIFLDSVPLDTHGILILDIRMSGMDGFELQKKLVSHGSPLRIIFITAHAEPGDRDQAMDTGALGFLQKPFNDQSLLRLINLESKKDAKK